MSDSYLKKEFKEKDVQRVRNIVNKDYTAKTQSSTGYQKVYKKYSEGDTWEEFGKKWTIKNGIKQNITKLDSAKKAARVPLACPKCGGSMNHWLAKKMYKIHGFCFDCTVDYEAKLRKAGLYEKYEKNMMKGNAYSFVNDLKAYVNNFVEYESTFVTEHGDVEDWNNNSNIQNKKVLDGLDEYLKIIDKHFS
jgi:hypothetical protein